VSVVHHAQLRRRRGEPPMAYVIEAKSEKKHLECLPLRLPLRAPGAAVEVDRAREDEFEGLRALLNDIIVEGTTICAHIMFMIDYTYYYYGGKNSK